MVKDHTLATSILDRAVETVLRAAAKPGHETRCRALERLRSIAEGRGEFPVILTTDSHKLHVGEGRGVLGAVHYGAPAELAGWESCAWRSDACSRDCLTVVSGRRRFVEAHVASVLRAWLLRLAPDEFYARAEKELQSLVRKASREGLRASCRWNGGTDLHPSVYAPRHRVPTFWSPAVRSCDYTKGEPLIRRWLNRPGEYPRGFRYAFSADPSRSGSAETARGLVALGVDIAIVIERGWRPARLLGTTVTDGDSHDWVWMRRRARDGRGRILALRPKGGATGTLVLRKEHADAWR